MDSTALQLVLTPAEELAECESIIARYKESFYDAGEALRRIRKKRLYRMKDGGIYKTFEDYGKTIWGWSRPRLYQLIDGFEAAKNLSTIVDKKVLSEGIVRPLTKLKQADEQVSCFVEAQKQAAHEGRNVAVRHVSRVVKDYLGEPDSWLIKPSDNWNFSPVFYGRIDGETGHGYIPGEIYANCLFYYTQPGDVVVDPMVGSGQLFRVYEDRSRWMRPDPWELIIHGFDLTPRGPYQEQIGQHDLRIGFPLSHADYIFLDVPYFGMVNDQYSHRQDDLANMDIDTWHTSIVAIAHACADAQNTHQLCTVFSPNYRDTVNRRIILTTRMIQSAFERAGYCLYDLAYSSRRIQQTQTANMASNNIRARENRTMMTDIAEVLTFRKS